VGRFDHWSGKMNIARVKDNMTLIWLQVSDACCIRNKKGGD
jgi:hypothetical protein